MWGSFLYFVIGNFLIALLEAYLLSKIFHPGEKKHIFLIMLGANYFSLIAGCFILYFLFKNFFSIIEYPLYFYYFYISLLWIISFILTVFLELPFIILLFKKREDKFKISLKASFIVQTVSYLFIFLYYLSIIVSTDIKLWKIEPPENFIPFSNIVVYYISTDNGNIYRVKLNGKGKEVFMKTDIFDPDARLFTKKEKGNYELWVVENNRAKLLVKNFAKKASFLKRDMESEEAISPWRSFGKPAYLVPEEKVKWKIDVSYWQEYGIYIENGNPLRIAFPDPFHLKWAIRNTIVAGENIVVFQSFDQIIVADIKKRKMGVITRGRGPVVAFKDKQ